MTQWVDKIAAEKILIVGPAWVGDMVLSQSLYMTLKQRRSSSRIDVMAPVWSHPLLARMPQISSAIEMPFAHGELSLMRRRRLALALRGEYQRAIVLPNSFKSALVPWWAQVPQRTGFRGEMRFGVINDMRALNRKALPRTVDRYVCLGRRPGAPGEAVPQPALQLDPDHARACAHRMKLDSDKPVLALMPGSAFGRSKRWPPDYFADVAERHLRCGWQVWVFGSASDRRIGDKIVQAAAGGAVNLCGKTSLIEAVDLISLAWLAISNDSGLMHVAAAVGVPLIAVYGATSPDFTPPMSSNALALWKGIECSPCYKPVCRYGHYRCLTEISPDEVCRQAERLRR